MNGCKLCYLANIKDFNLNVYNYKIYTLQSLSVYKTNT